jgi:hypothetical protein
MQLIKKVDWQELTKLTQGQEIVVERVRIEKSGIRLEGEFDLPKLAQLSGEDQVFVMGFLRCQGSIKEMEQLFGISYPTVKNRLAKINEQLGFVDSNPPQSRVEILEKLERGEISAEEAIERMKK